MLNTMENVYDYDLDFVFCCGLQRHWVTTHVG